jgi:hypothetical protein
VNPVTWIHIGGGLVAIATGTSAIVARKGGALHASAGTGFVAAMLTLGATASILSPLKSPPDSPIGGIMVCYFVATSWMTARRRDGRAARFEKVACALILALAPTARSAGPGPAAILGLGGFCLLAGVLDLNFILRGELPARQRLARHLWRMCFAFFVATGSFFLGQQDVVPTEVRGSPFLFVLAFAPFAVMLFWLVRLRFPNAIAAARPSGPIWGGSHPQPHV